jgi:hypothetical protein
MSDLKNLKTMLDRIGIDITHKKHPGWMSPDRVLISAAKTRICFSFSKNGDLNAISWGQHLDQV